MQHFAIDYGTPSALLYRDATFTNAGELLRFPECYRLLRLCGIPTRECSDEASDYELFRSFARALPILTGHPLKEDLCAFWKDLFKGIPLPSPDSCDEIWQKTAAYLLANPITAETLLKNAPCACLVGVEALEQTPAGIRPIVDAKDLLKTRVRSLADWQGETASAVEKMRSKGGDVVRICLPDDYRFEIPDLYHAEQALLQDRRTQQQEWVLLSQLVRGICSLGCSSVRLLLEIECDARQAADLLEYVERTVGLPTLFWASSPQNADAMLTLQAREHAREMAWCWRLRELPSKGELLGELEAVSARYPLGRLQILTDTNLLLSRYAQGRVALLMEEYCKKSL